MAGSYAGALRAAMPAPAPHDQRQSRVQAVALDAQRPHVEFVRGGEHFDSDSHRGRQRSIGSKRHREFEDGVVDAHLHELQRPARPTRGLEPARRTHRARQLQQPAHVTGPVTRS